MSPTRPGASEQVLRTLEREEQRAEEEKKRLAAEALEKIEPLRQIQKFIKGNFGL